MAKGKNAKIYAVLALTTPVITSFALAGYKKYREHYPYDDTTKTYNQNIGDDQPIIGNQLEMNYGALIYPGPDNAIYGNEGKNPYFDLTKERTVVAAVYEIENDFEIIKDRLTEMTVINNGGELVAVQTKCDGEVEGYFRIFDIKNENQKDNQKVK